MDLMCRCLVRCRELLQTVRLTEAEFYMKDLITLYISTLLALMAALFLSEVTAAVLFTPFQTRQEMFILLA